MFNKINTQQYGEKNLLVTQNIPHTYGLYYGEVSVTSNGSRFRAKGIFDDKGREVVPFGLLNDLVGTRVVNENIVILDSTTYGSRYGYWHHSSDNRYASYLLMKDHEGFKLVYTSDAAVIQVTHNMIYGANFEDYGEKYDYRIRTFEYNYQENKMIDRAQIDNWRAGLDGELALYFMEKITPYPEKAHRLIKVGDINGETLYKIER